MKDEDSTWPGLSNFSSSNDEDCMDRSKIELSRRKSSKRQPPSRKQSHQPFRLASLSSSEDESNPPIRRSLKRRAPPPPKAPARSSPSTSRSRSIHKRPLPRPSNFCGNLSDTSTSSSSSEDSLIFRSTLSLTRARKITTKRNERTNIFSVKLGSGSPNDQKNGSGPGAKLLDKFAGKNIARDDAIDKIQSDNEIDASENSSDSDDTAELVRQLTQNLPPRKKIIAGSSLPSQLLHEFSSPSPKPRASPPNKSSISENIGDRDDNDADDEGSVNEDNDDRKSMTGEDALMVTNSDSKPPTILGPPKEVLAISSNEEPSSNLHKTPQKSLDATTSNDPIEFELPTQSSSSEESSDSGEEEESSEDEMEENRTTSHGKTVVENWYSVGVNGISNDGVSDNDTHRHGKHQETIPSEENHRKGQEEDRFLIQTNQQLFETAFGNHNHHTHHHHHHQQYIDLVDSDDGEQQMQTQKILAANHFRREDYRRRSTGQIFENEESPRSPSRSKSPRFNIASRNFLYKKPWTNSNHCQHAEDEDVIQFEDDDRKVPARPRRVTQDRTNQVFNHTNQSGDSSTHGRPSVSSHFQPRQLSNPSNGNQEQRSDEQNGHRSKGIETISRPWNSAPRRSRRMRDPTTSNVSLAASVVVNNTTRASRTTSSSTAQSTASSNSKPVYSQQQHRRNDASIGDIRTFMSKRPNLAYETRNRAKSIETVRANRHDIQGHANVTVVNPPPIARGSRSRSQNLAGGQEQEDVIEVIDDDEEPVKRPSRSRKTAAPKAKTKRKRTSTSRKTKSRKAGGRKRTRKSAGSRGTRFGKRKSTNNNDDSGAWGSTGGGWASARPVHKEDPAFRNVGAEIAF